VSVDGAVLDAVREDPALQPEEKETTFGLTKRHDYFRTFTAEAGLARRLLAHPAVEDKVLTVADGDGYRTLPLAKYDGGDIVGLRARVPVGAVTVRSDPRQTTQHAAIVTDRVLSGVTR
jgi:hypothetical protein